MIDRDSSPLLEDPGFQSVLVDCLEKLDRGETLDRAELLNRHPEFAEALAEFLDDQEQLRQIAGEFRDSLNELPKKQAQAIDETIDSKAAMAADTVAVGANVRYFGDYELLEEVARGGMGVVYKARQVNLDRVVALKMILSGQLASEDDVRRFYQEAEAAANLEHPGIVPIFEIGEHQGQHFFSMGYIDGPSLAQLLADGPLPPREAAQVVRQVAEAIAYAHSRGVIHRDLKPANVLLARHEAATGGSKSAIKISGTAERPERAGLFEPKVTDFGLAKRSERATDLTGTGQILGTPSYMPPEQASGKTKEIGPTADVYSLGAILYCALTGHPPFQAANPMDTLIQVLKNEPPAPRQLNPQTPKDLETICLKCLQKEPHKRYSSAQALADDFGRWLEDKPILARPVGRVERVVKWVKRRPLVAGLLAAVLVVALTGAAAFAWAFGETVEARNDAIARQQETSKALKQTEKARQETADALNDTENARQKTADALADAERERRKKEKELLRAESLIYCMQTNKAHELLLSGDLVGCRQTLDECRRDLRGPAYGYLANQVAQKVRTLFSHTDRVASLAVSADGKRLYSGSFDQSIKVWDLEAGQETMTLRGHTDRVTSLALSADGKWLYSGSRDQTIKVWDLEAGKVTLTLRGHKYGILSLALSADGKRLYSGSGGLDKEKGNASPGEIMAWDLETGEEVLTLGGHTERVNSLALSPDGKRLYSGCGFLEGTVTVWDLEKWRAGGPEPSEAALTLSFAYPINSLALSTDGKRLYSGGYGITVWDLEAGKEILTLHGRHTDGVTSLALSADGKRLYSGCRDQTIKAWDTEKWQAGGPEPPEAALTQTLRGHTSRTGVSSLALSADGERLYSGSGGFPEYSVKAWNLEAGQTTLTLRASGAKLALSADGKRLCSSGFDTTIKVWDLVAGKVTRTLRASSDSPLVLSADGKRLYSGIDETIKVWDLETGKATLILRGHTRTVTSLALSASGKRLYSGSHDGTIKVWNLETGRETMTLRGLGLVTSPVLSLALSADGKRLYSGCGGLRENNINVWDLETGKETLTLRGHASPVLSLVLSADGKRLYSGDGQLYAGNRQPGKPEAIKVWDLEAGKETLTLSGHTDSVTSLALSPDGKRLYSGSHDKTIKVWDLAAGKESLTLRGNTSSVLSLALSADGKRLYSGSENPPINVWDLEAGKEGLTLRGRTNPVLSLAFLSDGKRVYSGSPECRSAASRLLRRL